MLQSRRFSVALLLTLFLCPALPAATVDEILGELQHVRTLSGISISPDGRWVTWSQQLADAPGNEILLLDTQSSNKEPRKLTIPGATSDSDNDRVSWAPDSSRAAFFSKPNRRGQKQIFRFSVNEAAAQKISALNGYIDDLQWSPDGSELSFLYAESGGGAGPLAAQAARTGEVGEELHNQRIAVMPANGGAIRQLSPPELNIYEYNRSHDGNTFAAIAAPGPADNNWWVAKLYTLPASGGDMHLLYTPQREQQIAIPRWSPDSKQIAFIGGLMSDQGFVGGDVFVIASHGGTATGITPAAHFSASAIEWQKEGSLLATASLAGGGSVFRIDPASHKATQIWKGEQDIHFAGNFPDMAVASDGVHSAIVSSTWRHAPEVWTGSIGDWQPATHINDAQKTYWGKAESVTWTDGAFQSQGWLLYPSNFDPSKRYPMVVSIHGGPSSQHSPAWPTEHFDMSVLAGLGYFVFFPNPRGSYGEGEAFTRANVRDFGGGDLKDVLAGVDTVLKKVPVDPARLGVAGWSYGGFMTMWTVTQTQRFHAAIAGAGIANWLSYYGENSIDEWMIPFFGASVYDRPDVYAKSSPITYIKQTKTPTLVLVGENDAECPAPQSFEFWHALKTLGVPSKLVVYPNEGHAFDDPEHNLDRLRRCVDWFNKYLNAGA